MKTTAYHAFIALLIACLLLPFAVSAAESGVNEAEFAAYKELAQVKLEATKTELQKDREKIEARLDSQDKRIGDFSAHLELLSQNTETLGRIIAVVPAIISIVAALFGWFGWTNIKEAKEKFDRETKDLLDKNEAAIQAAQMAAQERETALEDKAADFERRFTALTQQMEVLMKTADGHAQIIKADLAEVKADKAEVKAAKEQIQLQVSGNGSPPPENHFDSPALKQAAEALRRKPEAVYLFEDWDTRAFDAYRKEDIEGAARYWKSAANSPDATLTQAAQSLFNAGLALGQLNRSEEEIAIYDEVVQRFGEASEPALREQVAMALINKGYKLGQFNSCEKAIAVYDEVVQRFAEANEPSLRERVAMALRNKGYRLGQLNRNEEEVAAYDEVVQRFGEASEPALREQVAMALVNKGNGLGQLNRSEAAIAVYDEVLQRFGEASEPALRESVAKALRNKGYQLGQLNRSEAAIAVYDEVLQRFGDASEPALREQVAKALVNKGNRLGQLNRSEAAIEVYDEVLKRLGETSEPALREQVAMAKCNKGYILFCYAKEHWQDEATRLNSLLVALDLFKQAGADEPEKSKGWGNQAYTNFLLGQPDIARSLLKQALQQGGEQLHQATLADLDIHPVPPDADFRALLDEVWAEVQVKDR